LISLLKGRKSFQAEAQGSSERRLLFFTRGRNLSVHLQFGSVLLALAIEVTRMVSSDEGVLAGVFAQGLTIAAWVSLWEAIANLFLEWHPHRQNVRLYSRIMNAPVMFRHFQQDAD
jgi:hypothetical protein